MHSEPITASHIEQVETPAFIYSEQTIRNSLLALRQLVGDSECRILFTLKPFSRASALQFMLPYIDGFGVSSAFEAAFARSIIGEQGTVSITTPGFRSEEIETIANACGHIAFNSLSQWALLRDKVGARSSCGLRVNPQFSVVRDDRYNPCRLHSKLGVPLDLLTGMLARRDPVLSNMEIQGIHFHNNCDSTDFALLGCTARHLERNLTPLFERLKWMNMGGGYLAEGATHANTFRAVVEHLRTRFGIEVFIEPGAAAVRAAGKLVATVIDVFESNGLPVAVLDTTVNHFPEVFEYQFQPEVEGHWPGGHHAYVLAGCSCLAGDVFGTYRFERKLEVGSRVVFRDAGAYTLVKAHMFNGINLPTVYRIREGGELVMEQRFTYEDYISHNGASSRVSS